jgi:hypothetical protein
MAIKTCRTTNLFFLCDSRYGIWDYGIISDSHYCTPGSVILLIQYNCSIKKDKNVKIYCAVFQIADLNPHF